MRHGWGSIKRQAAHTWQNPDMSSRPHARAEAEGTADGVTVAAVLLACVAASVVSQAGLGDNPAFRVPHYQLQSVAELPLILVLGALGGGISAIFVYSSQVLEGPARALHLIPVAAGMPLQTPRSASCASPCAMRSGSRRLGP